MRRFTTPLVVPDHQQHATATAVTGVAGLPGRVVYEGAPQAVFESESLAQTLRQLEAYGRDGLPVLSADGHVRGWITNASVLRTVPNRIGAAPPQRPGPRLTAGRGQQPPTPLPGYRVVDLSMDARSSATGQTLGSVKWPAGSKPVSVLRHRSLQDPGPGLKLTAGDRVSLLIPASSPASTDLPDQTASPR